MPCLEWDLTMSALKSISSEDILNRGQIEESDVSRMRRSFYDDGIVTVDEAEQLFVLNDKTTEQHDTWPWFFVEALTDFIVNQTEPEGYITAENADWLIARISKDGKVENRTELDLLVNVLDKARWSPERLARYALEQVKRAVVDGDGPLRTTGALEKGKITEAEVDLVRRIVYAFGGDGNIAITQAEAGILFDIEDATCNGEACPAWSDLFAKVVANVMMSGSGYAPPSREEALRSESWLARRGELSPKHFLTSMVTSSLAAIWDSYHEQSAEERALARLERQRIEIITNERISDSEATWLVDRITRNGSVSPTEMAVLQFLSREQPNLHPALVGLIANHGRAA